jgi:hypothetical protein
MNRNGCYAGNPAIEAVFVSGVLLHDDHPRTRWVVVCLEPKRGATDDGIEILSAQAFVEELCALLSV